MSKVIYYVAMSLDGYIAADDGSVDWLEPVATGNEDLGYNAFYATLGAVVMGAATYEQILTFGAYPYADVESVVMTSRTLAQPKGATVRFSNQPLDAVVNDLKARHEKDIWIVGGGKLAAACAESGLIDQYDIALMPVLLHAGIPLLAPRKDGTRLEYLTRVRHHAFDNGITRLIFDVKRG